MRSDHGRLDVDKGLMLAVVNSAKINLNWFNRYTQLVHMLAQAKIQEIHSIGEFSRHLSRLSDQVSEERMRQWKDTQQRMDRIGREWSECIRGTETYDDPVQGGPVDLPSGYDHAWASGNGEYLLTDNPKLKPNVGTSGRWQQLRPLP